MSREPLQPTMRRPAARQAPIIRACCRRVAGTELYSVPVAACTSSRTLLYPAAAVF